MTTNRTVPTAGELAQLVTAQLTGMTAVGDSFTAHNVTQALRLGHPELEIAHREVRPLVHGHMLRVPGYRRMNLAVPGTRSGTFPLPARPTAIRPAMTRTATRPMTATRPATTRR